MERDLSIEELAVTIKTIKVNNRKMTLSVFKQLPSENIFHSQTLELKGVPWGKVNYYWGDKNPWQGIQVVWVEGNVLKRCFLQQYAEPSKYFANRHSDHEVENYQLNKLRELPVGIMTEVIKVARAGDKSEELKAIEVFSKYREMYDKLNSMDQIFIAT